MQTSTPSAPVSKKRLWTGRILFAIPVLFLLFDGAFKVLGLVPPEGALGFSGDAVFGLGIVELACVLLYLFPRTSILGAILLTGYLGGAIATHVRVGSPFFSHTIFPVYVALLIWGGLFLLEDRLRALFPLRAA